MRARTLSAATLNKEPYSTAAIWSWTSTVPSLWWTSCRILWPWKPLPRPSRRATTTLSELTRTESQLREKRSLTAWPPGALSLQTQQQDASSVLEDHTADPSPPKKITSVEHYPSIVVFFFFKWPFMKSLISTPAFVLRICTTVVWVTCVQLGDI